MVKWLVGCAAVAIVVGVTVIWFGYKKFREFTGAGPTTSVVINAPPARVFAALANVDSMKVWRQAVALSSTRQGMLRLGDTLRTQQRMPNDTANRVSLEVVSALVPDRLLVLETQGDATTGSLLVRRDSLVAEGDSTRVFSTYSMPATDSARARLDTSQPAQRERRMLDMASSLVVSVARLQAGMELRRLKARIEGSPMPDIPALPPPPQPPLPPPPPPPRSRQ
jgi:uncharacterized protein YndB with AHSA1/START domain